MFFSESNLNQNRLAYILITPVKDEENNLPGLIQSIVNQELKPIAWFIVDDGSQDRSFQIINQAALEYGWIHLIQNDSSSNYDIGKHYAYVCIQGFKQALKYCKQNNLKPEYIALSDADMIYPRDYFAKCISFLNKNPQYGIVSGNILIKESNKENAYEEEKIQVGDGYPYGTGRIWRMEAFIDTGGYYLTKSPDTVSNIKALLRGWKIKRLSEVVCYQTRATAGKQGLWNGYFNKGERAYYLNTNPLSIFNAVIDMVFISRQKKSIIKSFALFLGYFCSFLRREKQIDDEEIKQYMGSYKRVMQNYKMFLRGFTKKYRTITEG